VGIVSGLITIIISTSPLFKGESDMLAGVGKIATPLVATIGFLFMATVIKNVGLVDVIANWFSPVISKAPIQTMLLISALTGLLTQSNGSSAAVVVPMVSVVIGIDPEINRLTLACAAAGGCALMQYYLTGGPVAALATVIPVIEGSELKAANKFQRPSILFGLLVLFVIVSIMRAVL
jgi:di/tricarboxylate transporter